MVGRAAPSEPASPAAAATNAAVAFPSFGFWTNLPISHPWPATNGLAVGRDATNAPPGQGQGGKPAKDGTSGETAFTSFAVATPVLAHWRFDETSGTMAADSSGNNLHGTLSASGASFVAGGMSGNALQLDRAAHGYVNMGSVLNLTGTSFSIAVWMKRNAGDTTDASFIVTRHTPGYANGYFLNLNTAGGPAYGQVNKAMFYDTSGDVPGSAYSTTSMNDGQWHHLVAVYESGVQKRVYVDGTPVEGTGVAGGIGPNYSPFLVGGLAPGGSPTGYFTGWLDELIVFGKALSNAEIDDLYVSYLNILPDAPTGLAAVAGNQQATLTWSASSPGVTSYKVKRATAPGGPYTQAGAPTGTSFVDSALNNGSTYYYVVSAVNVTGEGPNSAEVSATPMAPPLPNAPVGLAAVAGSQQVTLSWTAASPGVTSYKVKRATAPGGSYTQVATPAASPFVDTGLNNGTTYYYVVSAINVTGEGPISTEVSATPVAPPLPDAPVGLAAVAGYQQVNLTWTAASPGVTSYRIKRATSASGPFGLVGSPTGTSFTDSPLNNGTAYYYVVSAVNGTGEGPDSASVSATPQGLPPSLNLLAHWKFDETAGATTASDSSGNGYHGVLGSAGASFVAGGKSGNALQLSKAANGYVNMGNVLDLTSGSFSIAVWVKVNPGDTTDASFILTKHTPGYPNGYFLNVNTAGGPGYGQVNKAMFYDPSGNVAGSAYSTTSVNDGQWHHLVAVYEVGVQKRIYVDGTPMEGSGPAGGITANGSPLLVGGLSVSGTQPGFFTGWLDELMIFGKALSEIEIDDLHNSYSVPPPVLPDAPLNLAAVAGDQQVSLSWSAASPNVTTYNVKYATSAGGPYTTLVPPVAGLGVTVNNLVNGTTYYFKVSANNAAGEGPDSTAPVSATPTATPTPPSIPANLMAVAGDQQVTLSWDPSSPGVLAYNVKFATSPTGPFNPAGAPSGTTFTHSGLINGTTYYYKVSAVNSYAESGDSAVVSATPTPPPLPGAPINLSATPGDGQVSLSWAAGTPAGTQYNVKYATTPGGPYNVLGPLSGTTRVVTGLINGTLYYFAVSALNAAGAEGPDSAQVIATPNPTPNGAPIALWAMAGEQEVWLSWVAPSPNVTSYNVKRATSPGGPYTSIGFVTGTAATDNQSVSPGTTYYYVVTALTGPDESPPSDEVSEIPFGLPAPPQGGGVYFESLTINFDPALSDTVALGPLSDANDVTFNNMNVFLDAPGMLRLEINSTFFGVAQAQNGALPPAGAGYTPTQADIDLMHRAFPQSTSSFEGRLSVVNQVEVDKFPEQLLDYNLDVETKAIRKAFHEIQELNSGIRLPGPGTTLERAIQTRINFIHTQWIRMLAVTDSLVRRFGRAINRALPFVGGVFVFANAPAWAMAFNNATRDYATDFNLGNDVTGSAAIVSGYCNDLAPGSGNIVLNYILR